MVVRTVADPRSQIVFNLGESHTKYITYWGPDVCCLIVELRQMTSEELIGVPWDVRVYRACCCYLH